MPGDTTMKVPDSSPFPGPAIGPPPLQALAPPPPGISGIVGCRALASALVVGIINALRAFGLVHLTPDQVESVNWIGGSIFTIFLALKGNRILGALAALQGTASATAATAISTAKEVGAEHVPDPAAPAGVAG